MGNKISFSKKIIYTQRVEIVESYGERRDCSDQNISVFIENCGYLPVPVPNVLEHLEEWVDCMAPSGIVLTGGNSLEKYGGNAPERDITDQLLLEIAIKKEFPVYGFCRGMQSILEYFGCRLEQVQNHVALHHMVDGIWGKLFVNSYHNQACFHVQEPLTVAEKAEDGVIEAIECKKYHFIATMWHPERENPFALSDMLRLQQLFG